MKVKKALSVIALAVIAATSVAMAQTKMGIRSEVQRELSRWKAQQTAAERDVQLTEGVLVNFFVATDRFDGPDTALDVNAAIQPLASRYPDYRLRYRTEADYCPIFRAIHDARKSALVRQVKALDRQIELLRIEQIHNSLVSFDLAEELLDKPRSPVDADRAFQFEIAEMSKEPTKMAWDDWDYLSSPPPSAGSRKDCN